MLRLPHPLVLMLGGIAVAAALTWMLPAGEFDRREDPVTGRRVAVAGSYHAVERHPERCSWGFSRITVRNLVLGA